MGTPGVQTAREWKTLSAMAAGGGMGGHSVRKEAWVGARGETNPAAARLSSPPETTVVSTLRPRVVHAADEQDRAALDVADEEDERSVRLERRRERLRDGAGADGSEGHLDRRRR